MDLAMLMVFPLLGAGLLATLLLTRILPPWLLQLSQEHGRFAGLDSAGPPNPPGRGRGRRIGAAAVRRMAAPQAMPA